MVYTNYIIECDNLNVCRPIYPDTNNYNDCISIYNSLYYLPLALFYTMVGFSYTSLISYYKKNENTYTFQYDNLNELKLLIYETNETKETTPTDNKHEAETEAELINESENDSESEEELNEESNEIQKQQEILDNMLSSKTVEKALVLYYIFIFKGNYLVKRKYIIKTDIGEDIEEEIIEEYNSYKEFKNMEKIIENEWENNIYNGIDQDSESDSGETNLFNLDESLEPNMELQIGKKTYNINKAHLNFISWVYSSGLYEYLTTNEDIKINILDEMNEQKLLRGNLFLRYHLLKNL